MSFQYAHFFWIHIFFLRNSWTLFSVNSLSGMSGDLSALTHASDEEASCSVQSWGGIVTCISPESVFHFCNDGLLFDFVDFVDFRSDKLCFYNIFLLSFHVGCRRRDLPSIRIPWNLTMIQYVGNSRP